MKDFNPSVLIDQKYYLLPISEWRACAFSCSVGEDRLKYLGAGAGKVRRQRGELENIAYHSEIGGGRSSTYPGSKTQTQTQLFHTPAERAKLGRAQIGCTCSSPRYTYTPS